MSHRQVILGLLLEQPMSGYDIRKYVQHTLGAVTNTSYGTLYPTLHRLLADGLVEMQEIPQQGRPSKKVYCITGKGRQELLGWLKQPPADDQVRREFLLKLFLAKKLAPEVVLDLIITRRGQTEAAVRWLQAEKASADDLRQVWLIDYVLSMYHAEKVWLDQVEHQIREAS